MLIIAPIGFFLSLLAIWLCFGIIGALLKLPGYLVRGAYKLCEDITVAIARAVLFVWRCVQWIHRKVIWIG